MKSKVEIENQLERINSRFMTHRIKISNSTAYYTEIRIEDIRIPEKELTADDVVVITLPTGMRNEIYQAIHFAAQILDTFCKLQMPKD